MVFIHVQEGTQHLSSSSPSSLLPMYSHYNNIFRSVTAWDIFFLSRPFAGRYLLWVPWLVLLLSLVLFLCVLIRLHGVATIKSKEYYYIRPDSLKYTLYSPYPYRRRATLKYNNMGPHKAGTLEWLPSSSVSCNINKSAEEDVAVVVARWGWDVGGGGIIL